MKPIEITARGSTHTGKVREGNEDAMLIDKEPQLYAVLDGMGGANAGDVASTMARDTLGKYVRKHRDKMKPRDLLGAGIRAANAEVHRAAHASEERAGMGTTVVACIMVSSERAVIAHVGDSRAYLWRDGRMERLTRDHTVVADLLSKKIITASEAEHHPYNNVLSRNLGSKPTVKVDVTEVSIEPGDRILLCSDGLTGYASSDAIEQTLGGTDGAEHAADDLIELALRGGGGDNITAIVIEAGQAEVPEHTQMIRTSGAMAWWRRRDMFLSAARQAGLCDSPVCSVLRPDEALEIVAGNLCEAIYHDLEQTTGINVWTYAENLAKGWFDQEGDYRVLRDLTDVLRSAAGTVLADISGKGEPHAINLEIAVTRGLTVAEMAIGGLLAERLRQVEAELVDLRAHKELSSTGDTTAQTFTDHATVPYMASIQLDPPAPEIAEFLEQAYEKADEHLDRARVRGMVRDCLHRAHLAAVEPMGPGEFEVSARDLVNSRSTENTGISPLLDSLDQARTAHMEAVKHLRISPELRGPALRRVAVTHRRIMYAVAQVVVENGHPLTEELRRAAQTTSELRNKVAKGEARLAELERKYATGKIAKLGPRPGDRQ